MNHVRRGVVLVAALVAALVVGCSDDGQAVTTGDSLGPQLPPFPTNEVVELPASPLGEWPQYNWVWMADGSGFVQAGAARPGGGGIDTTLAAAYFSFDDRRFLRLPDLPVTSGVGEAAGARVGDTLVVVGQDCPPMPATSDLGVEFCDDRANGDKVLLTFHLGDDRWATHDVPAWMEEFHWGTPTTIGVRDGRVVLASGHAPAHLAEFDPATGAWTRLADGAAPTQYCLVGDELVAYHFDYSYGQQQRANPREWWRLDGDEWQPLDPVVPGEVSTAACSRNGFYLTMVATDGDMSAADVHFVDPLAGTSTLLGQTSSGVYSLQPQIYGDTAVAVAAPGTPGAATPVDQTTTSACAPSCEAPITASTLPAPYVPPPLIVLTPTRIVTPPFDIGSFRNQSLIDDYLIDTGDVFPNGLDDLRREPTRLVKLEVG